MDLLTEILPNGTFIKYGLPRCPCDGGGWTEFEGHIIDFERGNITFYRTDAGHMVMPDWIRGHGDYNRTI